MPLFYAAVARNAIVLCEFHAASGNAPQVTRAILSKLPQGDHRKSYAYGDMFYHYHTDSNGLTVLVTSDDNDTVGTRIAFTCIADIRNQFSGVCGGMWRTATELSLNETFARTLREKLDFYTNNNEADKLRKAKRDVEDIQVTMKENISKVMDRGDRIDHLLERTNDLEVQSHEFKSSAVGLRRQLWWENKKYWLLCACITAIIIGVIVLIIVLVTK